MKAPPFSKGLFFLLTLSLGPFPAAAEGLMDIHEYDSSLAWGDRMETLLYEVLDRVTRFLKPVDGKISSGFGKRTHPILGVARHHQGIDISCVPASEVRAALSGRVSFSGWKGGYGKLVEVHHDGPISKSRYAHLSKILKRTGEAVAQGEVIGLSGMTGLVTGPHLHFEVYQEGEPVDPEKVLDHASQFLPFSGFASQISGSRIPK